VAPELTVVIDCQDLDRLTAFWTAALDYRRMGQRGQYVGIRPADGSPGPTVLLQQVPESKSGKNRLHFDLRVDDLDAELTRLLSLGARKVSDAPLREHGFIWWVLADPEGNEFCAIQRPSTTAG
jgi:predicted enzyme related to lactoylglutathione lyase